MTARVELLIYQRVQFYIYLYLLGWIVIQHQVLTALIDVAIGEVQLLIRFGVGASWLKLM